MGAVINQEQDDKDASMLKSIAELAPCYKRYLSHHSRNSISGIMMSVESAIQKLDDPVCKEEVRNSLYRIKVATEHLMNDLEKAGI